MLYWAVLTNNSLCVAQHLRIESHWRVNGSHYQRTLEGWLQIMDSRQAEVLPLLERTYGAGNGMKW